MPFCQVFREEEPIIPTWKFLQVQASVMRCSFLIYFLLLIKQYFVFNYGIIIIKTFLVSIKKLILL